MKANVDTIKKTLAKEGLSANLVAQLKEL